jgi:hypothetical protein
MVDHGAVDYLGGLTMQMFAFFIPMLQWLFRAVLIKFVVLTVVMVGLGIAVPIIAGYIAKFAGVQSLTDVFSAIPPGVWWWLSIFRLDFGMPLLISASVASFVIRRLPVVG